MEHDVGTVDEVRREGCRVVDVGGRPVTVIAVDGGFVAVHDRCPHMGAPMSRGTVSGTFVGSAPQQLVYDKEGGVIRCPWHGWEFDLATGRSLLEPQRVGLRVYPVTVDDGIVVLHS